MKNIDINEFLKKYANNECTEKEHREFIEWLNGQSLNKAKKVLKGYYDIIKNDSKIREDIKGTLTEERRKELLSKIEQEIIQSEGKVKSLGFYHVLRRIAAVAALFFVAVSVFYYTYKPQQVKEDLSTAHRDITSITLQDGSVVNLDSIRTGEEIVQGSVKIHKSEDGHLVYNISEDVSTGLSYNYNTINTSTGRQSFVKLSDGTKIWLNAASSLKFPLNFTEKERVVELNGEAYFEVSKEKRAFKVVANRQEIEVLGTHFNVNAYSDNLFVKTTLLEGSVKLISSQSKQSIILRPGEQGIGLENELLVKNVDVNDVMAWKNGLFIFSNESIHSVMKEISRWYNVEVTYSGSVTKEGFVMNISRSEDINDVLKKLEFTGLVHFKVEGRRVIVMP